MQSTSPWVTYSVRTGRSDDSYDYTAILRRRGTFLEVLDGMPDQQYASTLRRTNSEPSKTFACVETIAMPTIAPDPTSISWPSTVMLSSSKKEGKTSDVSDSDGTDTTVPAGSSEALTSVRSPASERSAVDSDDDDDLLDECYSVRGKNQIKDNKVRPCKGKRERYRKLVARLVQHYRSNPNSTFDINDVDLPPAIARNSWLVQKLRNRVPAELKKEPSIECEQAENTPREQKHDLMPPNVDRKELQNGRQQANRTRKRIAPTGGSKLCIFRDAPGGSGQALGELTPDAVQSYVRDSLKASKEYGQQSEAALQTLRLRGLIHDEQCMSPIKQDGEMNRMGAGNVLSNRAPKVGTFSAPNGFTACLASYPTFGISPLQGLSQEVQFGFEAR